MIENFGDEAVVVRDLPLIWMPWWSKPRERDSARMEKGREGLRTQALPYLEEELAGQEYLCGAFTLADAPYMALAIVLDVDRMSLESFPRVAAYLARLRARPSYQPISPQTSLAESAGRE
jgi:glutathione S-transferase